MDERHQHPERPGSPDDDDARPERPDHVGGDGVGHRREGQRAASRRHLRVDEPGTHDDHLDTAPDERVAEPPSESIEARFGGAVDEVRRAAPAPPPPTRRRRCTRALGGAGPRAKATIAAASPVKFVEIVSAVTPAVRSSGPSKLRRPAATITRSIGPTRRATSSAKASCAPRRRRRTSPSPRRRRRGR